MTTNNRQIRVTAIVIASTVLAAHARSDPLAQEPAPTPPAAYFAPTVVLKTTRLLKSHG